MPSLPVSRSSSTSPSAYVTANESPPRERSPSLSEPSLNSRRQQSGPLSGLNSLPLELTQQIAGEAGLAGVIAMRLTSKRLNEQLPDVMVTAARTTQDASRASEENSNAIKVRINDLPKHLQGVPRAALKTRIAELTVAQMNQMVDDMAQLHRLQLEWDYPRDVLTMPDQQAP
jgi:hypothetical protein